MEARDRGYRLACYACDAVYEDDGVRLDCERSHQPSLLHSVFPREFAVSNVNSMMRYREWLPRGREIATDARTGVYRGRNLGDYLGLSKLWVAFSGWWPQRGATLQTTTFKELEAFAVLSRLAPGERRTLVIASAGNTAAAFARAATKHEMSVLIIIPESAWPRLASLVQIAPWVRVVTVAGGQYDDAIALSRGLAENPAFVLEGGVRNVARRDGMGTVMLEAVEAIGSLPDAYVQGVGSGAGALAVHEAALRIVADGRYGTKLPQLHLAQNAPFSPIHDAWETRSLSLAERSPQVARDQVGRISAAVLSNLAPPYGTRGGVRDALEATDGRTYAVTNDEVQCAMAMFSELEGIDIEPAAGVAVAALIRARRTGEVAPDAKVLLHITGGGAAQRRPIETVQRPSLTIDAAQAGESASVRSLFA